MSLRWRIALALAAIAAVVLAVAAVGAYIATAGQLEHTIDESLVARAQGASAGQPPGPRRPGPSGAGDRGGDECPLAGDLQPASAAQLLGPDGSVTACIDGAPALPVGDADLALARRRGTTIKRTVTIDGTKYRLVTASRQGGGAIEVGRDLDEVTGVLGSLRIRLAGLALAGVAAAGLLGWLVASRIVRPVIRLRDTAESIASTQDLTTPVPAEGEGEVGSLARSFTTMVQALATSREQQQRLISDAGHEMRTPLTSLRTNLELLERLEELEPDERREVLAAVQLDVDELTHLLTELVELATDRANDDEPAEPVELLDLATDVADRARRRSGRIVTVVTDAGDERTVLARPMMVTRAISNLVDNALKYSPDGTIEVLVGGGRLEVRDHGPGIPPGDQPYVFDRFYRATVARSAPGSGLGLAIVKQIVDRHGGRVWAVNHPSGGAAVGFELPVTNGAS